MSTERRSAFSRAVRSIKPNPLQQIVELRTQLENLCDRAEEWRAISEFVEPEAIAIRQSRALLARLDAEGK